MAITRRGTRVDSAQPMPDLSSTRAVSEKEYGFSIDEAVEYLNRGRVREITRTSGSSNGMGYTRGYAYGGYGMNRNAALYTGGTITHTDYNGSTSTGLNPYWITAGQLKEMTMKGEIDAYFDGHAYYYSLEDLQELDTKIRIQERANRRYHTLNAYMFKSQITDVFLMDNNLCSINHALYNLSDDEFALWFDGIRKSIARKDKMPLIAGVITAIFSLFLMWSSWSYFQYENIHSHYMNSTSAMNTLNYWLCSVSVGKVICCFAVSFLWALCMHGILVNRRLNGMIQQNGTPAGYKAANIAMAASAFTEGFRSNF